jgi:hypothetical protein
MGLTDQFLHRHHNGVEYFEQRSRSGDLTVGNRSFASVPLKIG